MSNLFEQASRLQLRFPSAKGDLSVEDLWFLPLQSETGKVNLDSLAVAQSKKLDDDGHMSFVSTDKKSDPTEQLRFDILRHVIDVLVAERKRAAEAQDIAKRKQLLRSIIAEKQEKATTEKSVDELQAELNALNAAA